MATSGIIFSDTLSCVVDSLKNYPAVFVVSDRKIKKFITDPLTEELAEKGVALRGVLEIKATERHKTLETIEQIHKWLIEAGADRDALILAVGGGITTDLAGFAAATYKRGVRYANVPTTLLAQADAAIGGKTACNIGGYKNMCGAFLKPDFTFINPDYIKTQDWDHFTEGYAELLKTFIIADAASYEKAIRDESFADIASQIRRAAEIKNAIVEKDFLDNGERQKLNFGHTFAHAIEKKSRGRISHGHAVAIGMIMAAELSEREGVCEPGLKEKLRRDFEAVGLPTNCKWSAKDLTAIIRTDKKAEDGKINFVLIKTIGECVIKPIDPMALSHTI